IDLSSYFSKTSGSFVIYLSPDTLQHAFYLSANPAPPFYLLPLSAYPRVSNSSIQILTDASLGIRRSPLGDVADSYQKALETPTNRNFNGNEEAAAQYAE
ncbi:hypothetical protein NE462_27585, partial [Blautia hominis]|nr:hypothetical protein [Blautia hominis]